MKYEYAEIYQINNKVYLYNGINEEEVEFAKNYIYALNMLGKEGWKAIQFINRFNPS